MSSAPCAVSFVRDWILRGERANDLDVVICPRSGGGGNGSASAGAVHPASSDKSVAELRRRAHTRPCVEALVRLASLLPLSLEVAKSFECAPNGSTNLDFLCVVVLRPRDAAKAKELGSVQVELCLGGAYAAGEVDADVNNLAVGGGVSMLPRDAHVPYSPPHVLRHALAKQFAYVRQAGLKLGLRRLWKLHWRGWKRVATIPWTHPAAGMANGGNGGVGGGNGDGNGNGGGQAATALLGASVAQSSSGAHDPQPPQQGYKVPPWSVCPATRLEMGV